MTLQVRRVIGRCSDRLAAIPLVGLIGLGLVARLAADLIVPAAGVDLYEFGVIAENVVQGRGYSYFAATPAGTVVDEAHLGIALPSAFMPPLYVGVVVAAVLGSRLIDAGPEGMVWFVRLINLALACITMAGLARLVSLMGSGRAARLAVLGFALYPAFVYQATQVSDSNAYLAVEVVILAQCAVLARRFTLTRLLLIGLLAGSLALLRAEAVVVIVALAVWVACFAGRGQLPRPSRLAITAAVLGIALIMPTAWLVRSSVIFERPIVTITTTGGFNFWIGNHPTASGSQKEYSVPPGLAANVTALPPSIDYELDRDVIFGRAAWEEIASSPLETVVRDGKKLLMLVTVDPYDQRSLSAAYLGGYAVLVALGGCGAIQWFRTSRHRDGPPWRAYRALLGGWLGLSLAVPTVFFALARFRLPLELTLLMGAAVLLAGWAEDGARHSSRPAAQDVLNARD